MDAIQEILRNKKYKAIDRRVIEKLVFEYKDIDKVKSKLHQIWGAYYTARPDFSKLLKKYQNKQITLLDIARIHSSTRERLSSFEEMFKYIFENIEENNEIVEIGSGLNPILMLLIPKLWEKYTCLDIDIAQQDFVNAIVKSEKRDDIEVVVGSANDISNYNVDVFFLFKLLPVLDQQENGGASKLLEEIKSKYIVVTLPSKSLGGKEKGMRNAYYDKYIPLIESRGYQLLSSKDFLNESVYIFKHI
ncbi:hypothetical protein M0R04_03175 [Candidatus Dojkabacteria bacterium]|jgi:16S rRNA (guanine(1405)-N(7))-methyltransferase|nr:hypothetical protein [Candidatus Dojkabacteria bacterium]